MIEAPAAAIDTSATLRIERSGWRSALILIGAALLAAGSIWLAQGGAVDNRGAGTIPLGIVGILIFGPGLIAFGHRLMVRDAVTLTLSPDGFHDIRATRDEVPWSVVAGVSTWTTRGSSVILIELSAEDFATLRLTPLVRLTSGANRWLVGHDILSISSLDLGISFQDLLATIEAYAHTHGSARRPDFTDRPSDF